MASLLLAILAAIPTWVVFSTPTTAQTVIFDKQYFVKPECVCCICICEEEADDDECEEDDDRCETEGDDDGCDEDGDRRGVRDDDEDEGCHEVVEGCAPYVDQFHNQPGLRWVLEVWNGAPSGANRAGAGTIILNGQSVLPGSFDETESYFTRDVTGIIVPQNVIEVAIAGPSGAFIRVRVTGFLDYCPPDPCPTPGVHLLAQKCGPTLADVCLSWTEGCPPTPGLCVRYDLWRSTSPTISVNPVTLVTNDLAAGYTDAGIVNDKVGLWFYVASDQTKPVMAIVNPAPGTITDGTYIAVNGTQTGAGTVYVNDVLASLGPGTFDVPNPPGVPVAQQGTTTIAASGKENVPEEANYSVTTSFVDTPILNLPPVIDFLLSTSCAANVPIVDGVTAINTRRPLVTITYTDPDPTPNLDPTTLRVYINGVDRTADFSPAGASQASFQITSANPLREGVNAIAASIADRNPTSPPGTGPYVSANTKAVTFIVAGPTLTSLSPTSGQVGSMFTVNGGDFDPTLANNIVRVNGVKASAPGGGGCGSLTSITMPSTISGPVTVEVDCLTPPDQNCLKSNELMFRTVVTTSIANINGITAIPVAPPNVAVFLTAGNNLYFWDGASVSNLGSLVPVTGMTGAPYDLSGNVYVGRSTTDGEVHRWDGSIFSFQGDTLVSPEGDATVVGIATNRDTPPNLQIHTIDDLNDKVKYLAAGSNQAITIDSGFNMSALPAGIANPGFPVNEVYFFTLSTGGTTFWKVNATTTGSKVALGNVPGGPRGTNVNLQGRLITARQGLSNRDIVVVDHTKSCGGPTVTCTKNVFEMAQIAAWESTTAIRPIAVADGCFPFPGRQGPCPAGMTPGILMADLHNTALTSRVYFVPPPSMTIAAVRTDLGGETAVPSKVFADFQWDTQTNTPDQQSIVLKVKLLVPGATPATAKPLIPDDAQAPFEAKVLWSIEDPDSVFEPPVDPNGGGGWDNRDCPIAGDPACTVSDGIQQWEEIPTYEFGAPDDNESKMKAGESQIKVRLPDNPGDNVKVTARVTVPTYGDLEVSTPVINIWKKLHLEADTMGKPIGPFQADDREMEILTLPNTTLVAQVFRAAFVETSFFDTGQDNFDVPFRYAVAASTSEVTEQAQLGRTAVSLPGYWVAYVQNAYDTLDIITNIAHEGIVGFIDTDPNENETPFGGGVTHIIPFGFTNAVGGKYCVLLEECIRDVATPGNPAVAEFIRAKTVAHEVGHQLLLPHPLAGTSIMTRGATFDVTLQPSEIEIIQKNLSHPGQTP